MHHYSAPYSMLPWKFRAKDDGEGVRRGVRCLAIEMGEVHFLHSGIELLWGALEPPLDAFPETLKGSPTEGHLVRNIESYLDGNLLRSPINE